MIKIILMARVCVCDVTATTRPNGKTSLISISVISRMASANRQTDNEIPVDHGPFKLTCIIVKRQCATGRSWGGKAVKTCIYFHITGLYIRPSPTARSYIWIRCPKAEGYWQLNRRSGTCTPGRELGSCAFRPTRAPCPACARARSIALHQLQNATWHRPNG